jgi:hypothetical protein
MGRAQARLAIRNQLWQARHRALAATARTGEKVTKRGSGGGVATGGAGRSRGQACLMELL